MALAMGVRSSRRMIVRVLINLKQAFQSFMIPRERSISHLLARLVVSIMVPLLAFSALVLWRYSEAQQERAEQQAQLAATSLARDIDRDVRGIIAALSGLASSPALLSDDLATFYEQANAVAALIGAPILLRDAQTGRQLLNTRLPFGAPLPSSDRSSITASVVSSKAPLVSDLVFGAVAHHRLVAIAVPVMAQGDVRSVLLASVEPERIVSVMSDQALAPNWITEVSDRNGTTIARSRDLAQFVGRPSNLVEKSNGAGGVQRVTNLDGVTVLRGYQRTQHGWLVAAFTPVTYIDGPVRSSWLAFLAIGVAALAIALPLTVYYARRIASSIKEIAIRASALERGEVVPALKTDIQEATQVAEILSTASITLRERTRMLAESAARFKSAFDQAAVGFEQTALDGRWLTLNGRFSEMLGYTRDECLKLSAQVVTHPEDTLVEAPMLKRLLRGDLPSASMEKRYFKKDGGVVWVRSTTSLVRDLEGAPLYFVSVVEDITTGQTARAVTARLAALVQASNDAIISLTPDGLIETWNPGAERLIGYLDSEIIGQHFCVLRPASREAEVHALFARGLAGEAFRVETELICKDKTLLEVAIGVSPINPKNQTVSALSITIEDISERRRWEQQLLLLNRELQHRVKNSLSVVQSIANQTSRSSPSPHAFREAFQGRLQALAAANDLLLRTEWSGCDLDSIVDEQLKALLSEPAAQLTKSGPRIALRSDLTVPVGLALHELGTNALKFGALSVASGHVDITWTVEPHDGRQQLNLTWSESGGPAPRPSERRGFGSTLILRGIPGAAVVHRLTAEGVVCQITLDLDHRTNEAAMA